MEAIVVEINDKNKVQLLTDLLQSLDFVESVRVAHKRNEKRPTVDFRENPEATFFSFAGIWADRDITVTSLRNKAWPRNQK